LQSNRAKEARKTFLENECAGLLNIQLDVERKILEVLNEKTVQDKSVHNLIKRVENMQKLNEELVSILFLSYIAVVISSLLKYQDRKCAI
jgi:hypothetical protein